jgi:carboxyl-terminal processing protease
MDGTERKDWFDMLTGLRRLTATGLITLAMAATAPLAARGQDAGDQVSVSDWSNLVWASARSGDEDGLQRLLAKTPEGFEAGRLAQVREVLVAYQTSMARAAEERVAARDEAIGELRRHIEAGSISPGLRAAVTYQTLCDDLDAALAEPDVQAMIDLARTEIPKAEADGDWLYAQEVLFRLRTLYDDTSDRAMYNKYDRELKDVNRRVAYLQLYAPKRMHELRERLAKRYDEPPIGEFNPNNVDDWRERVADVDGDMMKIALRATAFEHIEAQGGQGWRPLLHGGIEALETLATTAFLSETFPGLADAEAVREFTGAAEEQLAALARTPDATLQYRHLDQIVDDLAEANSRTIKVPEQVFYREFGEGAMFELSAVKEDEYSDIIWPDEIRRFRQQTEGNFVGVGIIIRHNDRRDIVVVNPIEGTPAFRAGVRPEDIIVRVDDRPTAGWSLNDAVDRITGQKGRMVKIGIRRETPDGVVDQDFEIVREEIELAAVNGWRKTALDDRGKPVWDWMIDPVNRIGYVRLTSFNENTYAGLRSAWTDMKRKGVEGLILDLRHNPGGLLDQAVDVANMFVSTGEIVAIEGKNPADRDPEIAQPNRAEVKASGIPVAVLVNRGSASASEIVSGALQAHGAAVIVGTRTWGKGSVQRVYGISRNPDAQLKLTTQYYRLPPTPEQAAAGEPGRLVHRRPNATEWGVEPDVHIDMTPDQVIAALNLREQADHIGNVAAENAERPDPNELITGGVDPQLATALLILQARVIRDAEEAVHARLN